VLYVPALRFRKEEWKAVLFLPYLDGCALSEKLLSRSRCYCDL